MPYDVVSAIQLSTLSFIGEKRTHMCSNYWICEIWVVVVCQIMELETVLGCNFDVVFATWMLDFICDFC